jgi:hypothetical protein
VSVFAGFVESLVEKVICGHVSFCPLRGLQKRARQTGPVYLRAVSGVVGTEDKQIQEFLGSGKFLGGRKLYEDNKTGFLLLGIWLDRFSSQISPCENKILKYG